MPLSEAFQQFQVCSNLIDGLQLNEGPDIWTYIWGSAIFTSSKAYDHLIGTRQVHPAFNWLWKSSCQNKRKLFFWLWLKSHLNTRALLRRKNRSLEDYNCVLCNHQIEKTMEHLFLFCPFAEVCWASIGVIIPHVDDIFATLDHIKTVLHLPFFYGDHSHHDLVNLGGTE